VYREIAWLIRVLSLIPDFPFFASFPVDVIPEVLTSGRIIRDLYGGHTDPCSRTRFLDEADRDDEQRKGDPGWAILSSYIPASGRPNIPVELARRMCAGL